ncbi:hypothetical protein H9P43_003722 [Blastocladiella emersonii ATCC 22665]|nr:hypothetical protein H9P43_003722 [Blastocladiella emersonii ATCC 22665]
MKFPATTNTARSRAAVLATLAVLVALLAAATTSVHAETSCGRQNGGTVCADGSCCSAKGVCAQTWEACGKGCQSGACLPVPGFPFQSQYIDGDAVAEWKRGHPADTSSSSSGSGSGSTASGSGSGSASSSGSSAATTSAVSTTTTTTTAVSTSTAVTTTATGGGSSACTSTSCLSALAIQKDEHGQYMGCAYQRAHAYTLDDGPELGKTDKILDVFLKRGIKATFYIVGQMGATANGQALLKRQYAEGHHVASHTNTHADLATLTTAQIRDELFKTEAVIKSAIGLVPNYMRCPYGSITASGAAYIQSLGYKMIYWNLDSLDWQSQNATAVMGEYKAVMTSPAVSSTAGIISLQHDIQAVTAGMIEQVLDFITVTNNQVIMTTGDCLGDPKTNWYRSALRT